MRQVVLSVHTLFRNGDRWLFVFFFLVFPGLVAISSPYLSRLRGACCARPHGHCNAPLAFSISPGDPDGSWDGSTLCFRYPIP